ncbi:peptidoglycan-binding protein [Nocardia cyriacigeorgica]|uniref:peptidoglycan-binding domain-containing protein n=1 Tax=Nocardia cyriacigeorgica TaxID=135487 RepID=UPI0018934986|nr:peptidoglycan-binding domain-containing protein [Nocardia cyriacigeorgica]MBF6315631.1 peptidoglycan-binding protein [Nocardia cyriacigeorgica]MBF6342837.1 peptidoglycan-binding protein [Nocardia cyriacigeorgica]MBF6530416.1 peptidoglycan-binding protein [Nocardia cyriacigeorgica]
MNLMVPMRRNAVRRVLRAVMIAAVATSAFGAGAQASPRDASPGGESAGPGAAAAARTLAGCAAEGTTLRSGSRGECVSAVQSFVSGYYGNGEVAVDGKYGDDTADAVRNFQRYSDIRVDGVVGPDTWQSLVSSCVQRGIC